MWRGVGEVVYVFVRHEEEKITEGERVASGTSRCLVAEKKGRYVTQGLEKQQIYLPL